MSRPLKFLLFNSGVAGSVEAQTLLQSYGKVQSFGSHSYTNSKIIEQLVEDQEQYDDDDPDQPIGFVVLCLGTSDAYFSTKNRTVGELMGQAVCNEIPIVQIQRAVDKCSWQVRKFSKLRSDRGSSLGSGRETIYEFGPSMSLSEAFGDPKTPYTGVHLTWNEMLSPPPWDAVPSSPDAYSPAKLRAGVAYGYLFG